MRNKKILIAACSIIVIVLIIFFFFKQVLPSGVEGYWVIEDGDDDCFIEMKFYKGTPGKQGIVFYEKNNNDYINYRGFHKVKGDQISIEVTNFDDIVPFDMTYHMDEGDLKLDYDWNGESLSCTYIRDGEV